MASLTASRLFRQGFHYYSVLGSLAFFLLFWFLDFPKPSYDDLFYCGAALNLANGGDFSNPLLERQQFPSHYFFVYPPLHSYVLAGWVKLFGVSAASVTFFQNTVLLVISIATIQILRRSNSKSWLEWLVPLGVAFAFFPLGLRAEPLAVALAMLGFAVGYPERQIGFSLAVGLFLIFLGASTAPRIGVFAAALAVCAGYQTWCRAEKNSRNLSRLCIICFGSLLAAIAIFLPLIRFRLEEFLRTFHFHAVGRITGTNLDRLYAFAKYIGVLQWPVVLLPLGLLLLAIRKPRDELSTSAFFLAAAFLIAVCIGVMGFGTIWFAILIMFLLARSLAKVDAARWTRVLPGIILIVLLIANRKDFVMVYGMLSGKIELAAGEDLRVARALKSTPEHPLLIDSWVARYAFNYQLPKGSFDLEFGTPFPGSFPGGYVLPQELGPQLRKGDIFLAGPQLAELLTHFTYLEETIPKWAAFGLSRLTFEKCPRQVYIIPAERCRGLRN